MIDGLVDKVNIILEDNIFKIVFSKVRDKKLKKVVIEDKLKFFQISKYTNTQVFHENIDRQDLREYILKFLSENFFNLNAWSDEYEYSLNITKKQKVFFNKLKSDVKVKKNIAHNRKKNYIFPEGEVIDVLVDMGIFTKDGKVVKSMYDKYKQINRFIEIIDDAVKDFNFKKLNIIDFGCGKSYLSFLVYHYLTNVKGIETKLLGLDLKADVIEKCNIAAKKYAYTNMSFELGDIRGYEPKFDVDMVITLHACDTATDYALYNGIKWKSKMIFSVPCCQHELNLQLKKSKKDIFTRYGIIKERFSGLMTDSIRANLLEYKGYNTDLLEFIDFSHTPKNILIRAIKNSKISGSKEKYLEEVRDILKEYNVNQTLYKLLFE